MEEKEEKQEEQQDFDQRHMELSEMIMRVVEDVDKRLNGNIEAMRENARNLW